MEPAATPLWQTQTSQVYKQFHAADFRIWLDDKNLNPDTVYIYMYQCTEHYLDYSVGKPERKGQLGRRGNKWEPNT